MASLTMTLLAVGCALTLTGGVDAQTASINKIHPNPPQHQSQPPLRNEESGSNVGAPEVPLLMQGKPINVSHTVIAMVVDRSGSMVSMGPEVAGGCNAYLDAQRAADLENNRTTTVLLTTFDTVLERVVDGVPLPSVDPVTQEQVICFPNACLFLLGTDALHCCQVAPRGGTALHDAIGDTIVRTIHHLNTLPAQPDVVVFILTDGEENSSQTWKAAAISDQIKRLEKKPHGWTFYFAAGNLLTNRHPQCIGLLWIGSCSLTGSRRSQSGRGDCRRAVRCWGQQLSRLRDIRRQTEVCIQVST